ncbi:MAG: hypothetical protein CL908_19140 [Deltaproteobacteria bacterium]|nr:hypothetical protein [Deltaproteobacteria bacterium]
MPLSAIYRPHPEAPARALLSPWTSSGAWTGIEAQRFEVVSRGDFVPGLLYLPESPPDGGAPLLLLAHGLSDSMHASYLGCAARWVPEGLAAAVIDLPLHGSRSSPKLSERLVAGLAGLQTGVPLDTETLALVEEFARQATSDWIRTLDALCDLPVINDERVAYLGFDLGSVVGSYLLGHDERIRAAALTSISAGKGPEALDPASWIARAKTTSTLVLTTEGEETFAQESLQAFFEAIPEPKHRATWPGHHQSLAGEAMQQTWAFLRKELGL